MFREISRQSKHNGLLTPEEIDVILKEEHYCIFSCITQAGYPMSIPINLMYHDGGVYIHTANSGEKYDSILQNDHVSILVWRKRNKNASSPLGMFDSVLIYGRAEILDPLEPSAQAALQAMAHHFKQPSRAQDEYIEGRQSRFVVVKINVDHISGKHTSTAH